MAILFLLATSRQALVIAHFKLNRETMAQKFCINKNRPKLQCHGSCYLKKIVQEKENTDPETVRAYKTVDLVLISDQEFVAKAPKIIKHRKTFIYKEFQHSEPCLEIFVPPPIFSI